MFYANSGYVVYKLYTSSKLRFLGLLIFNTSAKNLKRVMFSYTKFNEPMGFEFPPEICPPLPYPIPFPRPQPDPYPPIPGYPEIPKFPSEYPIPKPELFFCKKKLKPGCYIMRYTPKISSFPGIFLWTTHYDGTMRVEESDSGFIMSGDLYTHRPRIIFQNTFPFLRIEMGSEKHPGMGIPIHTINEYRYYLRVTNVTRNLINCDHTITFERHEFSFSTLTWTYIDTLTAVMKFSSAPSEYPDVGYYLSGDVKDSNNNSIATLTMGWVSSYLRKATVEIDHVAQSETPAGNGAGLDWLDVFDDIGWDLNVLESDINLQEVSGESWSDAELHQEMLDFRDADNLDVEWRYHLLCVRQLDSTSRGIMYDAYGGDSNNIPREGAAISSHWMIPDTDQWGLVRGERFGAADAPYFRTAIHEIGHAMGLYHNTSDTGFMNTTGVISLSAVPPEQFPDNVLWSYNTEDEHRLKHLPDIWVRPGGIAFGNPYGSAPISQNDLIQQVDGLTIESAPLYDVVPLGAPVRMKVKLTNTGDDLVVLPNRISIKSGSISGKVIDPTGNTKSFSSIVRCLEDGEIQILGKGDSITEHITLLRGRQGALFSQPGLFKVEINISWNLVGVPFSATTTTEVLVDSPRDQKHAKIALKMLSTPDTLLALVIGGDHLNQANEVIEEALENNVLRPHFAYIKAKRMSQQFKERAPDYEQAYELLKDNPVMSPKERVKMKGFMERASQDLRNKVNEVLNRDNS